MLEEGPANVKGISREVNHSLIINVALLWVSDLDGLNHLEETFSENLINPLLIS